VNWVLVTKAPGPIGRAIVLDLWNALLAALRADLRRAVRNIAAASRDWWQGEKYDLMYAGELDGRS
jgi:hypothetical protein